MDLHIIVTPETGYRAPPELCKNMITGAGNRMECAKAILGMLTSRLDRSL